MPLACERLDVSNSQLRDRFQGAALGLMLVPSALLYATARSQVTNLARQDAKRITQYLPHWLEILPNLLRYHDHTPADRHRRILKAGAPLLNIESSNTVLTAQRWVLSDVLSWALKYRHRDSSASRLRSLADEIVRTHDHKNPKHSAITTNFSPIYHHYYGLWTDVLLQLSQIEDKRLDVVELSSFWLLQQPIHLTTAEKVLHQCVMTGILGSVLPLIDNCHKSYAQVMAAVANATIGKTSSASSSGVASSLMPKGLSADDDSRYQIVLVAGLIFGAAVGRSSLPVLWQRGMCVADELPTIDDGVAIADQCFEAWRGRLPG